MRRNVFSLLFSLFMQCKRSAMAMASLLRFVGNWVYSIYAYLLLRKSTTHLEDDDDDDNKNDDDDDDGEEGCNSGSGCRLTHQQIAVELQRFSGVQIFQSLCIPDLSNRGRREMDLILLTKRRLYVIEVKNWSGVVKLEADGSWLHIKKNGDQKIHPNVVEETRYLAELLELYLASRGVTLSSCSLEFKVVFVNPNCRVDPAISSQSEVLSFDQWENFLRKEAKKRTFEWSKFVFPKDKKESLTNSLYKQLHGLLSTAPTWDRLELEGGHIVTGKFLHFKGWNEDIKALKDVKRSHVSHIEIIHRKQQEGEGIKLGMLVGSNPGVELNCMRRDYSVQITSKKTDNSKIFLQARVRPDLEVVFQPVEKKKPQQFKINNIMLISLSV